MFYEKTNLGYILRIRVTPNSCVSALGEIFTDASNQDFLKASLNAQPEKGKANIELIKLLSKTLKISKSSFSVIYGQTDRYKKVLLETTHSLDIEDKLNSLEKKNE
ncbi:MAG: DUF167 domain-containing protein [Alphaproteobacteria bacterium]|nr:DUF167 domain-containing protein [Alphaproteobacteria bacterium]